MHRVQARSAVILTGLCVLGVVLLVCLMSERAQGEIEMTLAGSADVEMGARDADQPCFLRWIWIWICF